MTADVIGQRLHIQYDAAKLTTADMVDAVGQTGMRMWLEHEEPRASAPDVRARFWLTVGAGVALVAGLAISALERPLAAALCFVAGALVGGIYPARRAVTALRTRTVDINVLMVIAVAGALALGEWSEASSVVFLFALAQWLEARTLERARQAIRALVDSDAARGDRQMRWRRAAGVSRRRSPSATWSSSDPGTRCRSTARSSPATATSTKRR